MMVSFSMAFRRCGRAALTLTPMRGVVSTQEPLWKSDGAEEDVLVDLAGVFGKICL